MRSSAYGSYLFDLDGTLVDSDAAHAASYASVFAQNFPAALDGFDYEQHKGRPTLEVMGSLGAPLPLAKLKQQQFRQFITRGEVKLLPGALEILKALTSLKKRLFLVTGASRQSTQAILESHQIDHFFEGIITAEDVSRGKPNPEPYLTCLTRYHLSPSSCLAIEDATNGVISALKSGASVLHVNSNYHDPSAHRHYPNLNRWLEDLKKETHA